jgi:multidrug efflux system membrane fusion protein
LSPQDKVIVDGVQKVFFPGMPVSPTTVAMAAPPPQVKVASVAGGK